MTQKDSTLVRVLRTTKADLEQLGRLWAAAYVRGVAGVPEPNEAGVVTVDQVIRHLLKHVKAKQSRSRSNSGPTTAQASPRQAMEDLTDKTA